MACVAAYCAHVLLLLLLFCCRCCCCLLLFAQGKARQGRASRWGAGKCVQARGRRQAKEGIKIEVVCRKATRTLRYVIYKVSRTPRQRDIHCEREIEKCVCILQVACVGKPDSLPTQNGPIKFGTGHA